MIKDFQELKIQVKNYMTIYDVLSWYGVSLNRYGKGRCVLHGSAGNECFYVNPRNQRYTCYSCGRTGDALSFIQEMEGTDFIGAVYIAGVNLGLISQEECNNRRINVNKQTNLKAKEIKKPVEVIEVIKQEEEVLTEADIDRNSNVYDVLAYNCGLEPEDREKLLKERHIREDRVGEYFTVKPDHTGLIAKMECLCKKLYGYSKEDIAKVPGFYLDDKGNLHLNNKMRTIAIRIKDSKGRTRMVQLRNKFAKENDVKYFYLSSNAINGNKAKMWVDVLYPNNKVWKDESPKALLDKGLATVIITEGKFKAEIIADTFKCPVISIPGIKTFEHKVRAEIENINSIKQMKNVMIMLDADMADNIAVGESVIKMLEEELNGLNFKNIFVVVWDNKYGKGADDVIINKNQGSFVKVKGIDFIASYKQFIEDVKDCDRNNEEDRQYMNFLFDNYVIKGGIVSETC